MAKQQFGIVGLGVMGQNLALNLASRGVSVAGFDLEQQRTDAFAAKSAGKDIVACRSQAELLERLAQPRRMLIMVPAGPAVDAVIASLRPRLDRGDLLIDGGNTWFRDTDRRIGELRGSGILYLGVGISGGEEGALHGPSIMPGGDPEAWPLARPVLQAMAARATDGVPCCDWVGPGGAGHFVKMVHNGVEYGMMQAYAEGFALLRAKGEFELDLHAVAETWRHGSVVRSWLLDLIARALAENPGLEGVVPAVGDSGEGRWTVFEAIQSDVPAPVITLSLISRLRSRDQNSFADRLLAAMRYQFGGHLMRMEDPR